MPRHHHRADHIDELSDVLREIRTSIHRLVELVESMLDELTSPRVQAADPAMHLTAPRSVAPSARSDNSTIVGVFDLSMEDLISFAEASMLVPTNPHPSVSTISRWCTQGTRGIKLESTYFGGRRKTSRQAVERFLAACRRQGFAGMHDNTANELERALAEREAAAKINNLKSGRKPGKMQA